MTQTNRTLVGVFDGYASVIGDKQGYETKLGGTPIYPRVLGREGCDFLTKESKWTRCGVCGKQMSLLLQAYSPLPVYRGPVGAKMRRLLFIFGCNTASCTSSQPAESFCCFSVQVRVGDDDDADDDSADPDACYDDAEVDSMNSQGDPMVSDDALESAKLSRPRSLPPFFVHISPEPPKKEVQLTESEKKMLKSEGGAEPLVLSEEQMAQLESQVDLRDKKIDYYYEKFRSRISRAPTQVLRYHARDAASKEAFSSEASQEPHSTFFPLFMNPDKVEALLPSTAAAAAAPAHETHAGRKGLKKEQMFNYGKCPKCEGPLTIELQIMPTAIHYWKADQYTGSDGASNETGLDFSSLTLLTCSNYCSFSGEIAADGPCTTRRVQFQTEKLLIETPPTLEEEERARIAEGSGGKKKKTLRELLEGSESDESEDDGHKQEEPAVQQPTSDISDDESESD